MPSSYPWQSSFLPYAFPCCACSDCPWFTVTDIYGAVADLTAAEALMAADVVDCVGYMPLPNANYVYDLRNVNVATPGQVTIDEEIHSDVENLVLCAGYIYLALDAGTFSVSGSFTWTAYAGYNCTDGSVDITLSGPDAYTHTFSLADGSFSDSVTLPADGCYLVSWSAQGQCECPPATPPDPPPECTQGGTGDLHLVLAQAGMVAGTARVEYGSGSYLDCT